MKFTRISKANWKGGGKDGKGTLTTASKVLNKTQYSFSTRFENGKGTNPEELVGAAHAGCFAMQLSFLLVESGFKATSLDVEATITFQDGSITKSLLDLTGKVKGIKATQFREIAKKAKEICPVSKLLKADITLKAKLV